MLSLAQATGFPRLCGYTGGGTHDCNPAKQKLREKETLTITQTGKLQRFSCSGLDSVMTQVYTVHAIQSSLQMDNEDVCNQITIKFSV